MRQLSAPLELVYPAGHAKHDFESFAYVPSRQAWKPEAEVELSADPGGIRTKLVPPTEMLLGGIWEQFSFSENFWYRPGGQLTQSGDEDTDAKRPGTHWMQDTDPLIPE